MKDRLQSYSLLKHFSYQSMTGSECKTCPRDGEYLYNVYMTMIITGTYIITSYKTNAFVIYTKASVQCH